MHSWHSEGEADQHQKQTLLLEKLHILMLFPPNISWLYSIRKCVKALLEEHLCVKTSILRTASTLVRKQDCSIVCEEQQRSHIFTVGSNCVVYNLRRAAVAGVTSSWLCVFMSVSAAVALWHSVLCSTHREYVPLLRWTPKHTRSVSAR